MNKWNNPEVVALDFTATENGGKPSMNFDQQWFDQNGALHVNFVPDENPTKPVDPTNNVNSNS